MSPRPRPSRRRGHRRSRRARFQPQGREPARHRNSDLAAMTDKDRADLDAALERASTGSRSPSCSGRRTSPKSRRSSRAARWSWPRSRSRRRSRGSTRSWRSPTRSWWRAAISASKCRSRRCRALQKRITRYGAPARQAGRRGDADARIDDHRAGADPRRSVGRRDRGFRGRGRRHALGRKRLRRHIRVEAVATMNRIAEEVERDGDLPLDHQCAARRRPRRPAPTRSPPRPATCRRNAAI